MPETIEHLPIKGPRSRSSQRCSSKISLQQHDAYAAFETLGMIGLTIDRMLAEDNVFLEQQ
jgi:hypothetical protein